MTETMTLTIRMEADSMLRTARMLEAAADALDPGATDAAQRQEALEAENFARTVAQMTAEEVQRVLDADVVTYGVPDDADQRKANAETEDNDGPPPEFGTAEYLCRAVLEAGATECEVNDVLDGSSSTVEIVVTGGDDQTVARAIHAATPVGVAHFGNTLIGFTGDDGRIHEVRFSRPQLKVAPISPPARTDGDVELDAAGYAWDERIHSSARSKTKDGRWKYLRGVDRHLVEEVQFKQKNPAATLEEAASAPAAGPETVPPPATTPTPVPPPPPPPAVPAGELIQMPPDATNIRTFRELMPYIGKHKFTQVQLMDACKAAGAQSVPILMQRQDLIPAVVTALEAQRAAKA